jgi:hypothetical protein
MRVLFVCLATLTASQAVLTLVLVRRTTVKWPALVQGNHRLRVAATQLLDDVAIIGKNRCESVACNPANDAKVAELVDAPDLGSGG